MTNKDKRVLVGMSGGIDSTATCLLLQEQGYEVVGVTMRTWDSPSKFVHYQAEEPDYVIEARELAQQLGIEHWVADVRTSFNDTIIKGFMDEYLQGRTPNPCVMCNPQFKFRLLCEYADAHQCQWIATGHYGQIEKKEDVYYIVTGDDSRKDQSYFLWRLGQEVLSRCIFPLGHLTKPEVRAYLASKGFVAKSKEGESMEVCFIEGDYRDFLRERMPDLDTRIGEGAFVNEAGVKLGCHKGFPYYTIGQRKGLEIALGKPAYVLRINAEKNTVMLGDEERLHVKYMLVNDVQWTDTFHWKSGDNPMENKPLSVRIRYHATPVACTVRRVNETQWLVTFLEDASAVTPGQSAVFYEGRRLVGGAFISSQRGLGMYIS